MANGNPRGYFKYVLAIDVETTGVGRYGDNPAVNLNPKGYYQAVSWGLIVASAATLKPIDGMYAEVKWDKKSIWSREAEEIHGLSKKHLAKHGVDEAEAVLQMGELISKYWKPDHTICLLGHNVASFDKFFLAAAFRRLGVNLKLGARHIDSYSIGQGILGVFNSTDLFDAVGLETRDPSKHNAFMDASHSLESVRRVRKIFNQCVG